MTRSRNVEARIPVSVLTGFLGSGKTTVLNHLVHDPRMDRALVVINEFGSVGLDHELMMRSSDELVVEMMGGCLCCTISGDLLKTLREAPTRFSRDGRPLFDRVVIETTGLADPAPILHTLMTDQFLQARYELNGVIATVDGATGMATLDKHPESVKQAAVADRLIITKPDLGEADRLKRLEWRLAMLNPGARITYAKHGQVDPGTLFDCGIYDPASKTPNVENWLNIEAYPQHDHDHHHDHDINRHDERIRAVCLTLEEPLVDLAFDSWITVLTNFKGEDLLRIKAIINIAGIDRPLVLHGVQHILHMPVELEEWPSEDRRTRMVLIVRDMDEDELRGTLQLLTDNVGKYGLEGLLRDPEKKSPEIAPTAPEQVDMTR